MHESDETHCCHTHRTGSSTRPNRPARAVNPLGTIDVLLRLEPIDLNSRINAVGGADEPIGNE
ncbi:hypothetical protein [Halocatena salina]|uniref:Uncharacterized protein n=1 Tax=Halocatena salina TaxID=2934340 RepID=A0A8U0A1G0_9EURY|nr:hypothetical protein [Halocatena salina]UPM42619.1 hypothetical protein MW046_11725 [Halocatena salina]